MNISEQLPRDVFDTNIHAKLYTLKEFHLNPMMVRNIEIRHWKDKEHPTYYAILQDGASVVINKDQYNALSTYFDNMLSD